MLAFPGLDAPRLSREHSVCGSKPVGLREMLQTLRSTKWRGFPGWGGTPNAWPLILSLLKKKKKSTAA